MEKSSGRQIRRGEHLKTVRAALVDWRFKTHQRRYTPSPYTAVVILPDATLTTLASNARIKTIDDMNEILNPSWVFASRHGQEVLDLLAKLDESEKDDRECEKLRKREERKKETAECREAERLQKSQDVSVQTNSLLASRNSSQFFHVQCANCNTSSKLLFFYLLNCILDFS